MFIFIGFATKPIVKPGDCNAVRVFNNRCCQNYIAQGTNSTGRASLARMHWEFSQGLDRIITDKYQKSIAAFNAKWI